MLKSGRNFNGVAPQGGAK